MSNESTQLTTRPRASQQLASFIGMDPDAMIDTIKAQCFRGNPANISNEQLAAFVSIAAEMGVNPLLPGMLYALPIQGGGVIPIMGPDGVYKKLMEHPEVDSWETEVFPTDVTVPPTHAITKIWRKGRERPLQYTALLSEWKVGSNPNWNSRARHMLSIRSLKQCARQIIHGIPGDEDDRVIMGEINVTPEAPKVERAPVPERKPKGARAAAAAAEAAKTVDVTATEPAPAPEVTPQQTATEAAQLHEQVTKVIETAKAQAPKHPLETFAEPIAAPAKAEPRTTLADKEVITADFTLRKVFGLWATYEKLRQPTIQAEVIGKEYAGIVYAFGAAKRFADDNAKPEAPPPWTEGNKVRLTITGKFFEAKKEVLAMAKVAEEEAVF
jgi:hypothetical protein